MQIVSGIPDPWVWFRIPEPRNPDFERKYFLNFVFHKDEFSEFRIPRANISRNSDYLAWGLLELAAVQSTFLNIASSKQGHDEVSFFQKLNYKENLL